MSLILILGGAGPQPAPSTPGAYSPETVATLILEVSTADALDPTQTWLDLSDYLRGAAGGMEGTISIDRGRDSETDRFKSATMSLWLDNTTRKFDTTNGASPFAGALKARRQVRLRAHAGLPGEPISAVYTLYRGFVRGWPRSYSQGNTFSWVQLNANDGFRIFEQSSLTEGVFTLDDDVLGILDVGRLGGEDQEVELSGSRIEAIADMATWPANLRAIADGLVEVGPQETRSGLDALQQVEDAEDGYVFIDNDGTLTFYDRLAAWELERLTVSQTTIGPGADLGYVDIAGVGIDDARIRNDIRRTGASGMERSATDLDSVRQYGWATDGPETLIAIHDDDVAGLVERRIRTDSQPVERITSITLDVTSLELLVEAMSRRVLDRVTVNAHPPGGAAYEPAEVLVQGISHQITSGAWGSVYRLGPTPTDELFTLDDDVLGILDGEALLAP